MGVANGGMQHNYHLSTRVVMLGRICQVNIGFIVEFSDIN